MRLSPCTSCGRHVRETETKCPFCDAPFAAPMASREPTTRLGRAAMFAFRATAVAAISTTAACGDDRTPQQPQETIVMQPYGAPPMPPTTTEPPPPPPQTEAPPPTDVPSAPESAAEPHRRPLIERVDTIDDPGTGNALYGAPTAEGAGMGATGVGGIGIGGGTRH